MLSSHDTSSHPSFFLSSSSLSISSHLPVMHGMPHTNNYDSIIIIAADNPPPPPPPMQLTEGYSGSDIRLVCKEAAMHTVRGVFDKLERLEESNQVLDSIAIEPVRTHHIEEAIATTKPSARQLASRYLEWQKEYESV